MRKFPLLMSVLLLTSCSWFAKDLWSAYETLPLEVETLEDPSTQWVNHNFPLNDGTYLVTKHEEAGYYVERCSQADDSVLFTFVIAPNYLLGATLANGSLYLLMEDHTELDPEYPYYLVQMDNETLEIENVTTVESEYSSSLYLFLVSDVSSIVLVCWGNTPYIKEYGFDLELLDTYDFSFDKDINENRKNKLESLANENTSLITDSGLYFIFEQTLMHKIGQTVTQLPYDKVASLMGYENRALTFIQFDYNHFGSEQHCYVDRIVLDSDHQELSRDRLLSIENLYLEGHTFLMSFAIFDDALFIVGGETASFSSICYFGVLRVDLETPSVATYFDGNEKSSTDWTSYYNGHFIYISYVTDPQTTRQINFRGASA